MCIITNNRAIKNYCLENNMSDIDKIGKHIAEVVARCGRDKVKDQKPNGDFQYQKTLPEKFPRNIHKTKEEALIRKEWFKRNNIAQRVKEFFAKKGMFIAYVDIVGSTAYEYSKANSDIDLIVVYDDSEVKMSYCDDVLPKLDGWNKELETILPRIHQDIPLSIDIRFTYVSDYIKE